MSHEPKQPFLSNVRKWLASSPPIEWMTEQLAEILIGVLRQGPVPQHIAMVMDGNRRYAREHHIETLEGHHHGFEALAGILEVLYKSGVKCVTVYAFSIENFNRTKSEVDGLMDLAKVKLEQMCRHGGIIDRYGVRIKVIGLQKLIRKDVLEVVERVVDMTKNNNLCTLNIAMPYTSREEMTTAVRSTVQDNLVQMGQKSSMFVQSRISQKIFLNKLGRRELMPTIRDVSPSPSSSDNDDGASSTTTLPPDSPSPTRQGRGLSTLPNPENITVESLEKHMYTSDDPPLDIFLRTSGVERLSDFMLWQCHQDTHFSFLSCYWPTFNIWKVLPVILEWQWLQKQTARENRAKAPIRSTA